MRLGYGNFEVLILQAAVPYLKIKEASVIVKLHFPLLKLANNLLLFVALSPDLHTPDTDITNLLLQCF